MILNGDSPKHLKSLVIFVIFFSFCNHEYHLCEFMLIVAIYEAAIELNLMLSTDVAHLNLMKCIIADIMKITILSPLFICIN